MGLNSKIYARNASGSITVFLSLILLLILSLLLTITEGARVGIAKVYTQRALSTAMDSVLAEYYGPLWDEYHVFGLYHEGDGQKEMIEEKLKDYISYTLEPKKNLGLSENGSFEPYNIDLNSISVKDEPRLIDYQGDLLINEAVEYMKYREMGDITEQLFNKLSLMKTPEKVSYLYEEKDKAEEELVKIDKGILRLMELLDGLKTSKKGIEVTKDGALKTAEYFVKKICFGQPTKETVGINQDSVFQALKVSYVDPKITFVLIKSNFTSLKDTMNQMGEMNADKNEISQEITVQQKDLDKLNAIKDKSKKVKQQIKEIKKTIDPLKEQIESYEDDLSDLQNQKSTFVNSIQSSSQYLLQLISGIKPVISEAISTIDTIIDQSEIATPFVHQYEQILSNNRGSIDDKTYSGLEESLNEMKKYVSTDKNSNNFKGMKGILEKDLDILTQAEALITQGKSELVQEKFDNAENSFNQASEKMLHYQTKDLTLDYSTLVLDRSAQKNPVDALSNSLNTGILSMVIDPNKISDGMLTQNILPSQIAAMSKENTNFLDKLTEFFQDAAAGGSAAGSFFGSSEDTSKLLSMAGGSVNKLAQHLLYQEYLKNHFEMFSSEEHESKRKPSALSYEQEYLLTGKLSDQDNLSQIISRIVLIRTISDFVSILGDNTKKNEAKVAAAAIVGFTGLTVLVSITQVLILIAWSFAEALLDVCALMSGKEVPVIKKSIVLELPELFMINRSFLQSKVKTLKDTNELSMSYQDYLRIFLLLKSKKDLAYRSMDLMQENIKRRYNEKTFDITKCLFGYEAVITYTIPTKFIGIPLIQKYMGVNSDGFTYAAKAACSY